MSHQLRQIIESDIFRYYGSSRRPRSHKLRPAAKYMSSFRKAQHYRERGNRFARLLHELRVKYLMRKTLIQIPTKTTVGRGLYIGHMGSVIVNENAVIGNNVNLATGVTIGQTNRGAKRGCPTIGDRVWIGTNAVVVGGITIGDNVLIAPNSYVTDDIPANSIFAGNPGSWRPSENATNGYVNNLT